MLRPPIRVARPADWTGRLAFVGLWLGFAIVTLVLLLVRFPDDWIEALADPIWLRAALVAFALLLARGLGVILYTRLPRAVFMSGQRLVFAERGRRQEVSLEDVAAIVVDLRPPPVHEMFVAKLQDGSEHDLCPVHWPGAGRLYASLARRVAPRP